MQPLANNTAVPQPVAKSRRRWFQFSLRTLLIVVTVVGCVCGWLVLKMQQARKQHDAVVQLRAGRDHLLYQHELDWIRGQALPAPEPPGPAWLRRLLGDDFFASIVEFHTQHDYDDGQVRQFLGAFPRVKRVSITSNNLTDAGLENVGQLQEMTFLYLNGIDATDTSLQYLSGNRQLEGLWIRSRSPGIMDAGLHWLTSLPGLKGFTLQNSQITDAGLKTLALMPQLEQLFLSDSHIRGADLSPLTTLPNLVALGLENSGCGDDCLPQFAKMPRLRLLDLSGTQITDDGLAEIAKLSNLKDVRLRGTKITDFGLQKLAALSQVENLWINETQVTDDGLIQFLTALAPTKPLTLLVDQTPITMAGYLRIKAKFRTCIVLSKTLK